MSKPDVSEIKLCHWGRSLNAPTLSSFVLKMMTYLRMRDIPYTEEFTFKASSKGKMPYIKDGGKEVADSNFIISYFNEKSGDSLDKDLPAAADKAVSLAFKRLAEENLYWTLVYFNWTENSAEFLKQFPVTGFRKPFLSIVGTISLVPRMKKMLSGQGMGRHSKDEVLKIMEHDMTALSNYLGDKAYFMGDTPTEIDAALFGILGCCMYASPNCPHKNLMTEKLSNLAAYTTRMKSKYFPDWDKLLTPGNQ